MSKPPLGKFFISIGLPDTVEFAANMMKGCGWRRKASRKKRPPKGDSFSKLQQPDQKEGRDAGSYSVIVRQR